MSFFGYRPVLKRLDNHLVWWRGFFHLLMNPILILRKFQASYDIRIMDLYLYQPENYEKVVKSATQLWPWSIKKLRPISCCFLVGKIVWTTDRIYSTGSTCGYGGILSMHPAVVVEWKIASKYCMVFRLSEFFLYPPLPTVSYLFPTGWYIG